MFLAIFSKDRDIGLSINDETFIIHNACDVDDATEKAHNYAEKNNIQYSTVDVINLDDCESIN